MSIHIFGALCLCNKYTIAAGTFFLHLTITFIYYWLLPLFTFYYYLYLHLTITFIYTGYIFDCTDRCCLLVIICDYLNYNWAYTCMQYLLFQFILCSFASSHTFTYFNSNYNSYFFYVAIVYVAHFLVASQYSSCCIYVIYVVIKSDTKAQSTIC